MSKAKVVTRPNMVTKPVGNKHHSHRQRFWQKHTGRWFAIENRLVCLMSLL